MARVDRVHYSHFRSEWVRGGLPAAAIKIIPMSLPQDILDRLQALGQAPERYEGMARSEGVDFVHRFVGELEEADRLFHEWSPRLREFAANARAANPTPTADSLSVRDKAKLPIYASLINKAERLPQRRQNEVLLCSIPFVGIATAISLWPGNDDRCILLTPDEQREWQTIYDHPPAAFRWFTEYWWHIEDPPRPNGPWTKGMVLKTRDGTEPWLVVSGMAWGSHAGGETADLWSWDGQQAEFVQNVGLCDF